MKIIRVELETLELELKEPYTIAYETVEGATNLILKLVTDDGRIGLGCAAPDPVVTRETVSQVESAFAESIQPGLSGECPWHYARLLEDLGPSVGKSGRAMVDMALFDLLAQASGVPLYQFLGGYRHAIATSVTIAIESPNATLKRAARFIDQGFSILKLKGGLDVEADIGKLKALRATYPKLRLRFDANQGYDLATAEYFIRAVESLDVEIFEQPTQVGSDNLLAVLNEQTSMPVMADESLKTLADAFRLTSQGASDMVNIKLMKVGGILAGQHINSVAKAAGNESMVGCLDECGLGIAAGLHFALSRPNIEFADLDGHLDMVNDPYQNWFVLQKGVLYPRPVPGLGGISSPK